MKHQPNTCNKTMLRDRLRVFVSRLSPPKRTIQLINQIYHEKSPREISPSFTRQSSNSRFFRDACSKSERSLSNSSPLSFPTRDLGWLVNQRNPSRYWQITKGDLIQIISSLHDSFLFRSSFFIRF